MSEDVNSNSNVHDKSTNNYSQCKNMLDYYIKGIEFYKESINYATKERIITKANGMIANIQGKDEVLELQSKLQEFDRLATEHLKLRFDYAIKLENIDNISLSKEYETNILPALSGLINSHGHNNKDNKNNNHHYINNYIEINGYQKTHAFDEAKKLLSGWIMSIESGKPTNVLNKDTIVYVNKFIKELGQYIPDLEADTYDIKISNELLSKFNTLARDYVYDGAKSYEKHNVESPNSKSNIAKRYSDDKFDFSEFQKIFAFEESKNLLSDWVASIESGKSIANLTNDTIAHINKFVKELDDHIPYSTGNKYGIEIGKLKDKFNTLAKDYVNKKRNDGPDFSL